jgi:predicted permease
MRRLFRHERYSRPDVLRDVNEELEFHVALRTEQLIRGGAAPDAARIQARHQFAHDDLTLQSLYAAASDRNRQMRFRESFDNFSRDLRYAARRLTREPLVNGFIVLTLAAGIGANVTAFSLVDRLVLRGPEQVVDAGRLVRFYRRITSTTTGTQTAPWLPWSTFLSLRSGLHSVTGVAGYRVADGMVGTGPSARRLRVGRVIGAFFSTLGVRPRIGRLFGDSADAAAVGPQAVLSDRLWQSDFGGDPAAIGRSITIGDTRFTITGVAPAGFNGAELSRVDVWTLGSSKDASFVNWSVIGRLTPGLSPVAAGADAQAVHLRTAAVDPAWMRSAHLLADPIAFDQNGRPSAESVMVRWLSIVSLIILVITCANVVNLLLARLSRRRRELAIRIALGAGRARILRLLVLESGLLAVVSAGASLGFTLLTEPSVQRALMPDAGWSFTLADGRVFGLVFVTALMAGSAIGLVSAWRAGSPRLVASLRGGAREGGHRSPLRQLLTVVQAALSVLLLIGAGLFLRSFAKVRAIDLGMTPARVITAQAHYPASFPSGIDSGSLANERSHYRRMLAQLRATPGLEHIALSVGLPLGGGVTEALWVAGRDSIPALPGGGPFITAVSDDYFATMGTRIVEGRAIGAQDREGTLPVIVIGEAMAHLLWPGTSALGQCIRIDQPTAPCATVIGVAADVHRAGFHSEASLQCYIPIGQESGFGGMWLIARPAGDASASLAALRATMLGADPDALSVDARVLADALEPELRPIRLGAIAFLLSGGVALVVAALGLYSIMAYMVAWRTHEIGVRLALGATQRRVAGGVVAQSTLLALAGVAAGSVIAIASRRLVQPQLFDESAVDPVVLAASAGLLIGVALLAAWIPARRAARVHPTEALRAE